MQGGDRHCDAAFSPVRPCWRHLLWLPTRFHPFPHCFLQLVLTAFNRRDRVGQNPLVLPPRPAIPSWGGVGGGGEIARHIAAAGELHPSSFFKPLPTRVIFLGPIAFLPRAFRSGSGISESVKPLALAGGTVFTYPHLIPIPQTQRSQRRKSAGGAQSDTSLRLRPPSQRCAAPTARGRWDPPFSFLHKAPPPRGGDPALPPLRPGRPSARGL